MTYSRVFIGSFSIIFALILIGCEQNLSDQDSSNSILIKISLSGALTDSGLAAENYRVTARINAGATQNFTISEGFATLQASNLPTGSVLFELDYFYNSDSFGEVLVATLEKPFNLDSGKNEVEIKKSDFQLLDTDQDGYVSTVELAEGNNPDDPNDHPPKDRNWGTPMLIAEDTSILFRAPVASIDADGNANIAWSQWSGHSFDLRTSRYDVESNWWRDPVVVDLDDSKDTVNPKIVTNAKGDAILIWQQGLHAEGESIWASVLNVSNTQWTPGVKITDATIVDLEQFPDVAIDKNGNGIVVWVESVWDDNIQIQSDIWSRTYEAGTGWSSPIRIDEDTETQSLDVAPSAAFSEAGDGFVVWLSKGNALLTRRLDVATGWTDPVSIKEGSLPDSFPVFSSGANKNIFALWVERTFRLTETRGIPTRTIMASRYDDSNGWLQPEEIGIDEAGGLVVAPEMVQNSKGNSYVVWIRADANTPTTPELGLNYYGDKAGWQQPDSFNFTTEDTLTGGTEAVAIDSNNLGLVVWNQTLGDIDTLWSSLYKVGSEWPLPVQVSSAPSGSNIISSDVAGSPNGSAVTVWSERNSEGSSFWVSNYR